MSLAGEITETGRAIPSGTAGVGLVGPLRPHTNVGYLFNAGPRGMLGLGRLNLGDLLCSPQTYFHLEADHRLLIIGGGIQSAYITGKKPPPEGYDRVCVWGGGVSSRPGQPLPRQIPGIDLWTIRDRDCVPDPENWLPCASCMHPMLDHPSVMNKPGRKLLYVNADPSIYNPAALLKSRRMAIERGFDFATNRGNEAAFFAKWHDCEHVVTNSYHGAYWSLLAGKRVTIFGYNYKFQSLVSMFALAARPIIFPKNDRKALIDSTKAALDLDDPVMLEDHAATLDTFRDRQKGFARTLAAAGVLAAAREKPVAIGGQVPGRGIELKRIMREYIGRADAEVSRRLRGLLRQ